MPRGIKYDKDVKNSPEWVACYGIWKRLDRSKLDIEFKNFLPFWEFAMQNGFFQGCRLKRKNLKGPFSRDNICFVKKETWETNGKAAYQMKGAEKIKFMALWDTTVNRIRRHYGMEPIGSKAVSAASETMNALEAIGKNTHPEV